MPEDMGDPRALQVQTAGRFCASQDLPSLKDETSERLNDILDSVGSRLAHGEVDALSEQENFDDVYSLVRSVWEIWWLSACVGVGVCTRGKETTHVFAYFGGPERDGEKAVVCCVPGTAGELETTLCVAKQRCNGALVRSRRMPLFFVAGL